MIDSLFYVDDKEPSIYLLGDLINNLEDLTFKSFKFFEQALHSRGIEKYKAVDVQKKYYSLYYKVYNEPLQLVLEDCVLGDISYRNHTVVRTFHENEKLIIDLSTKGERDLVRLFLKAPNMIPHREYLSTLFGPMQRLLGSSFRYAHLNDTKKVIEIPYKILKFIDTYYQYTFDFSNLAFKTSFEEIAIGYDTLTKALCGRVGLKNYNIRLNSLKRNAAGCVALRYFQDNSNPTNVEILAYEVETGININKLLEEEVSLHGKS